MIKKPIVQTNKAEQDVNDALDYYLEESVDIAVSFIDDLKQAFNYIERHSGAGSNRYAHELNIPELKSWSLRRFPYMIFYIEHDNFIDVIRVLHGKMDIPAWMIG